MTCWFCLFFPSPFPATGRMEESTPCAPAPSPSHPKALRSLWIPWISSCHLDEHPPPCCSHWQSLAPVLPGHWGNWDAHRGDTPAVPGRNVALVFPVPAGQPGGERAGWCVLSETSPWENQGRSSRNQDNSRALGSPAWELHSTRACWLQGGSWGGTGALSSQSLLLGGWGWGCSAGQQEGEQPVPVE